MTALHCPMPDCTWSANVDEYERIGASLPAEKIGPRQPWAAALQAGLAMSRILDQILREAREHLDSHPARAWQAAGIDPHRVPLSPNGGTANLEIRGQL